MYQPRALLPQMQSELSSPVNVFAHPFFDTNTFTLQAQVEQLHFSSFEEIIKVTCF